MTLDARTRLRTAAGLVTISSCMLVPRTAAAQPLQDIGPYVVDVRGAIVSLGADATLASNLGVTTQDLPGRALGFDLGGHVYPGTWKRVTFGIGGHLMASRASREMLPLIGSLAPPLEVRARFTSFSPQVSFNFAGTTGYSYISGGIGLSTFALTTQAEFPTDLERIKTIDYGGGGRWFNRRRVAFSVDIRFYAINPQVNTAGVVITPRMTRFVISAGASFR